MEKSDSFEKKYKGLNKGQKEAVDTIYGPVMVIAGPGTGKTTVLTLRIANILKIGNAKPDEVLALTFTESGARAMREKLRELIGETSFQVNIFTFHGFANYIRSTYPENFKKIGERIPASDADKIEVIEYILSKKSFRELRVSDFGVTIGKISGRISDLKRELITSKELQKILDKNEHKERLDEFAVLYEEYEKELEKRKLYDFDDAILELIKALKENPVMRSEVRERFQFVLADEHQDANGSQNEILKLFKDDKEIDPPNIFVVGDDKQSIFRFQGASLEHFYNFADEFKGAKKITLEDNYRSQRTILEGSHSLISRDGRSHQKLSANVPHSEKQMEIVEYPEYENELASTAKQLKAIKGSVAVITRHNQTLHDLAPFLDAEGVNYRIAGERSLFESFEYRKLLSLFEALVNPYDGKLLEALYMGYFAKPIVEILKLAGDARKERVDAAELILKNDGEQIKEFITKAKKTELTEMLKEIREEMYGNATAESFEVFRSVFDEARKLVVKKRAAKLEDLVNHLNFLEKHRLATLSESIEREATVELLSVHRSKGLEYDHVYIVDATAKKFGGSGKRGDLLAIPGIGVDSELEEERRLLYVAITRARECVTISYSLTDAKGGESAPAELLGEIDPEFVIRKDGEIYKSDLLKSTRTPKEEKIEIFRDAFLRRSFSVSALNNFLNCPWKYFFRNLLLIPDAPEFHTNLGNACHNALKLFHQNPERKDLDAIIKQSVMNEPFSESELPLALEKSNEYIKAYKTAFVPFGENEKAHIEKGFSFVYKAKNFEIPITGKIDLAREVDGIFKVIDFKTKKRMTANAIKGLTKSDTGNEWRQLRFYKFLIEKSLPKSSVGSGTLTFLVPDDNGKMLSENFALTIDDKKEIEECLLETLESIYSFEFLDKKCEDKECGYCALSKTIEL
ncbi:MAG: UvrD/REP helicase, helicase / ATP-dependent helicase PcrA [Candidatus Taylorbacteria bacterium]|nr:UvrD/REP helicase, helicase / ATP-dependent helicase PcrA [Candidatus Taylorbacteria bacterium]